MYPFIVSSHQYNAVTAGPSSPADSLFPCSDIGELCPSSCTDRTACPCCVVFTVVYTLRQDTDEKPDLHYIRGGMCGCVCVCECGYVCVHSCVCCTVGVSVAR